MQDDQERSRRRAEDETSADRESSRSLLLVDEILSVIRHETNQPLAAVVANGNAALRWLGRPEPDLVEARRALERVISEASRASELLARTRELALPRRTQAAFDLSSAVLAAVGLTARMVEDCNGEIRLELRDRLLQVVGDRLRVEHLVVNLILEALRRPAALSDVGPITVSTGLEGTMAYVSVSVEEAHAPAGSELDDATGFALAVARNIAIAHDGALRQQHAEGRSAMIFTLPHAGT